MANYSIDWNAAKATFERSTGLDKPAPKGKVPLLRIEYRQSTHVDGLLTKIDKLLPTDLAQGMKEKHLVDLVRYLNDFDRYSAEYLRLLDRSIQDEKAGVGGKSGSAIYRDLKILKAALQGIAAKIKLDVQKVRAANEAQGHAQKQVFLAIVTVADSMRSAAKDGLLWGQQQLHRPDYAEFNKSIMTKARNITQPLANVRKWAMPGHIHPTALESRQRALDAAPQLQEQIQALYQQVITTGLKEDVLALLRITGTDTALDASLEELGNKGVKLPAGSPPEIVVAATKHFMSMAKAAVAIADTMQGIAGARVLIPDVLRPDPEDIPPDFEAPQPPPRRAEPVAAAGADPGMPIPAPRPGRGPLPPTPAPRLPIPRRVIRSTPPNKPLPPDPGGQ